jgi:hypothetical protein
MKDRLREPSTYAGLAGALVVVPELIANPVNATAWGALISALLAVFLRERGGG